MILNALNKKIDIIKANFHYGGPVAKNLIPEDSPVNLFFEENIMNYRRRMGLILLFI